MAWLRIDDGYTSNSKIAQLNDSEFRAWMRLLCHCARSRDPSVDEVAIREVSGLSRARIRRFAELGLIDALGTESERNPSGIAPEKGHDFEVHDWAKFLPKDEQNAARQAKWRARNRNAARNADSNAPSNANLSRAGAGTRGVPSRPVVTDQDETALQDDSQLHTKQRDVEDDEPLLPTSTHPAAEPEEVLRGF